MASLLVASNIKKRFGGIVAVDDVSIQVMPNEVKCIIGANGAGKSTLFNIVCGSLKPTDGKIEFEGKNISSRKLYEFSRMGIARKFQIPSVFENLTVAQNLEVALPIRFGRQHPDLIDEMIAMTELHAHRNKLAGNLAHGQKQWLEIGMAMMSKPKLLLLDEPTAGMTPEETQKTARLVGTISSHAAVVAIEHDMTFVRALGCHTYVMHQGRLIFEGTFSEIEENPVVRDVYLGKA